MANMDVGANIFGPGSAGLHPPASNVGGPGVPSMPKLPETLTENTAPNSPVSTVVSNPKIDHKGHAKATVHATAHAGKKLRHRPKSQPGKPLEQQSRPVKQESRPINPADIHEALGGAGKVAQGEARTKNIGIKASQVESVQVEEKGKHKSIEVAMHYTDDKKFKNNDGGFPPRLRTIGVSDTRNEVLYTTGISDCVAVVVLAESDGKVFQKRALVHLQSGAYSGNSTDLSGKPTGPNLATEFREHLGLDEDAMANCQVIVCFGENNNDENLKKGYVKKMALHLGVNPDNIKHMTNRNLAVQANGEYGAIKEAKS